MGFVIATSCGVGCRHGSDPAILLNKPSGAYPIQPQT